jgi:hypothetical protein
MKKVSTWWQEKADINSIVVVQQGMTAVLAILILARSTSRMPLLCIGRFVDHQLT